jgi:TonB family protein
MRLRHAASILSAVLVAACADVPLPPDDPAGTGVVPSDPDPDRVPAFRPPPEPLQDVQVEEPYECTRIGQPDDARSPAYPAAAAKTRQEGWVRLRFDLDEGQVVNPQVMASSPAGLFDEAVLDWARTLRYPSGASATSCVMEYEYKLQARVKGAAVPTADAASAPASSPAS